MHQFEYGRGIRKVDGSVLMAHHSRAKQQVYKKRILVPYFYGKVSPGGPAVQPTPVLLFCK